MRKLDFLDPCGQQVGPRCQRGHLGDNVSGCAVANDKVPAWTKERVLTASLKAALDRGDPVGDFRTVDRLDGLEGTAEVLGGAEQRLEDLNPESGCGAHRAVDNPLNLRITILLDEPPLLAVDVDEALE